MVVIRIYIAIFHHRSVSHQSQWVTQINIHLILQQVLPCIWIVLAVVDEFYLLQLVSQRGKKSRELARKAVGCDEYILRQVVSSAISMAQDVIGLRNNLYS